MAARCTMLPCDRQPSLTSDPRSASSGESAADDPKRLLGRLGQVPAKGSGCSHR
jgi:hypothetical protein